MITGMIMMLIIGFGIGLYVGWDISRKASTTIIKDLIIKFNAQDLIDIQESQEEVDNLKKDLDL